MERSVSVARQDEASSGAGPGGRALCGGAGLRMPVAIQPHQLLLQDFGDIETVQKLVTWLVEEAKESQHLEKIRREREFLQVMSPGEQVTPLKKEVAFLLDTYAPRRRWQYVAADGEQEETEDAMLQRCLLEYGERVTVAVDDNEDPTVDMPEQGKDQVDFMAQIASQAAAIASGARPSLEVEV